MIGDDIEIQVAEVAPTRVKLCITAPQEVAVMRKEVRLTRDANLAAAAGLERFVELRGRLRKKSSPGRGEGAHPEKHQDPPGRREVPYRM